MLNLRNIAFTIIFVVTLMFAALIFGLLDAPGRLMRDHWDVYGLFLVLPYGVAAALLYIDHRKRSKLR